jgi:uncharacterized protein (TIGR03382 family)
MRYWETPDPSVKYLVNSPIVYVHRCIGSSCTVMAGQTNSSTNRSPIAPGTRTLSAFSQGTTVWNNVMTCVRSTFAPFNLTITEQDPGMTPHYEVMVGGTPGQLDLGPSIAGIAPGGCPGFEIPSSLVFAFDVVGPDVNTLCATIAQEIAHSWGLDHSTDDSDPMSYFSFSGQRSFTNANVPCGSDCVNGQSDQGIPCTGQTRQCSCGGATQNTFALISNLFNDTPSPPTVSITEPTLGARVEPGFAVRAEIEDVGAIVRAEMYINNMLVRTITNDTIQSSGSTFSFGAPDDLPDGTHTVRIVGYDIYDTPGQAQVQVIIGAPCEIPGDCPMNTDTCIGGRCVPGPGVQGGLGSACENSQECSSGLCANGDSGQFCVEQCMLAADQCPEGFGCLDTGAGDGTGVCYPGIEESGGCLSSGGSSGPVTLGLAYLVLAFVRRRRR